MTGLLLDSEIGGFIVAALLVIGFIWAFPFIFGGLFEKAEKDMEKGNSCLFTAILILVAIGFIFVTIFSIKDCANDNTPWEPRHTQLNKDGLMNVNKITFNSYKA